MQKNPRKIPLLDLNQSSFHKLRGDEPELEIQPGGRVAFLHEASERFYELAARYNANEFVPVQDYVSCQRELRSRMASLKNENAKRPGNGSRT